MRSEADPKFLLKYTDVYVGEPSVEEDSYTWRDVTPFECRLRDCTYSAPIYVNVLYTRGKQVVRSEGVQIGRIPVMLRSSRCVLRHQDAARLAELKECPFDPGGYFVVKGVEKVILMQEQLSKNRVIIELDAKACVCASVTSSTHERKSRCSIFVHQRNRRVYLRHNTLGEDVPITVVLKAMGMESDQEIVQLVGPEPELMDLFAASLEEPCSLNIRTQLQALRHIGNTIRAQQAKTQSSGGGGWGASYRRHAAPEDEAREVLAHVVLSHVPVRKYDFRPKCVYIGYIVRRVLHAVMDAGLLDDKDYYGNKRLELAGQLLSLLFEDLFKRFNADVKKQADLVLSKPNRTAPFDVVKCFRTDTITCAAPRPVRILARSAASGERPRALPLSSRGARALALAGTASSTPSRRATGCSSASRWTRGRDAGLSRLSYISALGMMTRVSSCFEKTRKTSGPRAPAEPVGHALPRRHARGRDVRPRQEPRAALARDDRRRGRADRAAAARPRRRADRLFTGERSTRLDVGRLPQRAHRRRARAAFLARARARARAPPRPGRRERATAPSRGLSRGEKA